MTGAHSTAPSRQHRQGDPHEAVRAELQQDGGQDDRALRGRLRVGVGQPGVEREHRHLDGEAEEHAGEDPDLHVLVDAGAGLDQVLEAEALRSRLEEQCQEGDEHERRTEHRVEEELERGVLALLAAPHADHEVHRQQHELEEHEEQDQVLGDERARHARLQHEHQDEERLGVARVGHVVPGVDHHEERDGHRQEVERQADAVEPDRVVRVDHRDPLGVDEELQLLRFAVVELDQRDDADGERGAGGGDADRLDQRLLAARDEQHDQHAEQRQEDADAQEPVLISECFHEASTALSVHVDDDEDDGTDGDGTEEQCTVLVDLAGLGGLERMTGLGGDRARRVDDAVDEASGRRSCRPILRSSWCCARRRSTMPSITCWLNQYVASAIGWAMARTMTPSYRASR